MTPRPPVRMTMVTPSDPKRPFTTAFSSPRIPGEFMVAGSGGRFVFLHFICPRGCEECHTIPIRGPGAWEWDGNRERPTLTPSLKDMGRCGWHGFVTAGELITCGDSP